VANSPNPRDMTPAACTRSAGDISLVAATDWYLAGLIAALAFSFGSYLPPLPSVGVPDSLEDPVPRDVKRRVRGQKEAEDRKQRGPQRTGQADQQLADDEEDRKNDSCEAAH